VQVSAASRLIYSQFVYSSVSPRSALVDPLIKSKNDRQHYRFLKLPNNMRCILIQDEEADKSAVSLDVNVGCSLDQEPYLGTAHFLEHMLFLGT
jgi:secreted Zn-dependent insulinase-like peptidase